MWRPALGSYPLELEVILECDQCDLKLSQLCIKESTAESSGEGLTNGSASTFIHTYVEDDEEESDFDEDDIQVPHVMMVE